MFTERIRSGEFETEDAVDGEAVDGEAAGGGDRSGELLDSLKRFEAAEGTKAAPAKRFGEERFEKKGEMYPV